jgi:hypothetical protein
MGKRSPGVSVPGEQVRSQQAGWQLLEAPRLAGVDGERGQTIDQTVDHGVPCVGLP